jgi:hypothetical protein
MNNIGFLKTDLIDSAAGSSSSAVRNLPILKMFEREDWTLFRTVDGLQQKAGVPQDRLTRLVMKELTDNALDTNADVKIGELPKGGYFVEDNGPGLDGTPQEIAELFSIKRPLRSTKLLRLPQRGALGNGLRVVASAVLVSGGTLTITTRNRRIRLRPERDGTTTVLAIKAVKFPVGTRVEISFGPALPCDAATLDWATRARLLARGKTYTGKSSPWWYNVPQFHELMASGNLSVGDLMAQLDGDDDTIVAKAGLDPALRSANVTIKQARKLLLTARAHTEPVPPAQLGAVGDVLGPTAIYACAYGVAEFGAEEPKAEIPFAVEAWAQAKKIGKTWVGANVNRTPVSGNFNAGRDGTKIYFEGCNLFHDVAKAPKDENFDIWLNVISPYMPITSDGKEPDLKPFFAAIEKAVATAVRKARKPTPEADNSSLLPKRRRGRQSPEDEKAYRQKVKAFCKLILQIRSRLDFDVGSRGWCYLLEEHGLGKGDFDAGEKLINDCRKSGDLPLDICAEDASRDNIGVEEIDKLDVPAKADALIDHLLNETPKEYLPISQWDDLDVYVEMATEKLDLRNLFQRTCNELHVPITNFKGWSDINARAKIMRRFVYWTARGKKCVLLLCGDNDPGGLLITDTLRKNFNDLKDAMQKNHGIDWEAVGSNLVMIRFGLNADLIDANDLTWIDNLETSSGRRLDDPEHDDHWKDYVQNYIDEFGVKKCEANALVAKPAIGRQLCRDAILEHVPIAVVRRYERKLDRLRKQLRTALRERVVP